MSLFRLFWGQEFLQAQFSWPVPVAPHVLHCAQVGSKVMLGDRPVSVTLARCWAALSRWARVRFIFSLLWGGLFMGGADLKAQVEQLKVAPCFQPCTV